MNKLGPEVSVLIPWCGRKEIEFTLAANKSFFGECNSEVVVINSGGDSEALNRFISASGVKSVRQLNLSTDCFNKSLALNVGLHHALAPAILVLDADIVMLTDLSSGMLALHDNRSFVTIEWVYESKPPANTGMSLEGDAESSFLTSVVNNTTLEFLFQDGSTVRQCIGRVDLRNDRRAGPGLLLVRKQHLLLVEGYNSRLNSWGWEDADILVRLQHVLKLNRVETGAALHLTHGDDVRSLHGASRNESNRLNFLKCCANYRDNAFCGTYSADIASSEMLAEMPMPENPSHCQPSYNSF